MTKKEIYKRMSEIIAKYDDGALLSPTDVGPVMDVLKLNPDFDKKIDKLRKYGKGVCLAVERAQKNTRCFCLESFDRKMSIKISYRRINKSMSVRQQVSNALREADSERVAEFRKNVPDSFICPFTGMIVYPCWDKFDVDHYDKSVSEVAKDILDEYEDVIMKVITQGKKGGCVFVEPKRSLFKQYMAEQTKLRYASSYGNRKDGAAKKKNLEELTSSVLSGTFKSDFPDIQDTIEKIEADAIRSLF